MFTRATCVWTRRGNRIPWTWSYRRLGTASCPCREPNPSPLEEQQVFLATELPLQLSHQHVVPGFHLPIMTSTQRDSSCSLGACCMHTSGSRCIPSLTDTYRCTYTHPSHMPTAGSAFLRCLQWGVSEICFHSEVGSPRRDPHPFISRRRFP